MIRTLKCSNSSLSGSFRFGLISSSRFIRLNSDGQVENFSFTSSLMNGLGSAKSNVFG
jgi:hypothetical protein